MLPVRNVQLLKPFLGDGTQNKNMNIRKSGKLEQE